MISSANHMPTLAIAWLVIVFGCYFFNVARPELGTRWGQLPLLPERATSIELTRFGYVRAYAESGMGEALTSLFVTAAGALGVLFC